MNHERESTYLPVFKFYLWSVGFLALVMQNLRKDTFLHLPPTQSKQIRFDFFVCEFT